MTCPKCKADIDDDSSFCDQCGNEINVCPKCGKAGRGKVCTDDGTKLVPAQSQKPRTDARSANPVVETREVDVPLQVAPVASPTMDDRRGETTSELPSKLSLLNKSLGAELIPQPGDILGRTVGKFTEPFGAHKQVSGQHARITFDPGKGWCITDLGSTNGSKLNGVKIAPNIPQPLADRSYLVIGNIEFLVRIESKIDPSRTVRL